MPIPKSKIQNPKSFTFLITAGPTIEDIDPVRFISNRSSGKMGAALAAAALNDNHRVILIHGPVSGNVLTTLPKSRSLTRVPVRSAMQMHAAVMKFIRRADAAIMNAAVADYSPVKQSPLKLKKSGGRMNLKLRATVDILKMLGELKKRRNDFSLIGFALETGSGSTATQRRASALAEARRKLRDKNLDLIVLDSPAAMGADRSDFTILSRGGLEQVRSGTTKPNLARELVKMVVEILKEK